MDLYASSNRLKYIDKSIHVNDKEWICSIYLHEYLFYVTLCKKIMENRWGERNVGNYLERMIKHTENIVKSIPI